MQHPPNAGNPTTAAATSTSTYLSPDLAHAEEVTDALHHAHEQDLRTQAERKQQEEAQQHQQQAHASFFKHTNTKAGGGAASTEKTNPFIDHRVAQIVIRRLFFDSIARIRTANANLPATQTKIPHEELLLLHSLFPKELANALSIIDSGGMKKFISEESHRFYFRVGGSSATEYITTPFHCTCASFTNQVVTTNEKLYCKHQLAILLAEPLSQQGTIALFSDEAIGLQLGAFENSAATSSSWSYRGGGGGGRGGGGGGGRGSGH